MEGTVILKRCHQIFGFIALSQHLAYFVIKHFIFKAKTRDSRDGNPVFPVLFIFIFLVSRAFKSRLLAMCV